MLDSEFMRMAFAAGAVIGLPPDAPEALLAIPVGPWEIGVTAASLAQAAQVFLISFAAVGITLGLALTTPMVDITEQLRRWHVPQLFVELMTLIYRFIFVLLETAQAMRTAQEARLGYSSWGRWLRSAGMLASNLYLRANTRAPARYWSLASTPWLSLFTSSGLGSHPTECRIPRNRLGLVACITSSTGASRSPSFKSA